MINLLAVKFLLSKRIYDLWCYQHEENRKKSNSDNGEKQIKTGNIQTQLQQRSP